MTCQIKYLTGIEDEVCIAAPHSILHSYAVHGNLSLYKHESCVLFYMSEQWRSQGGAGRGHGPS